MKKNILQIGVVALGFIMLVPAVSAQQSPDDDKKAFQLVQIDAEEVSSGDDSRIRFSDFENKKPVPHPSQQTMSSSLLASNAGIEVLVQARRNQQNQNSDWQNQDGQNQGGGQNQGDQGGQWNQGGQNQGGQNQGGQNQGGQNQGGQNQGGQNQGGQNQGGQNQGGQNQGGQWNQGGQNQGGQNQGGQDWNRRQGGQNQNQQNQNQGGQGRVCPGHEGGRCPDDWYGRRCEQMGGNFIDGVCYMRDQDQDDRRDPRNDQDNCEDRGGIYYNEQCSIHSSRHDRDERGNNNLHRPTQRERCENRGGEWRNNRCHYDNGNDGNNRDNSNDRRRDRSSFLGGEEDDLLVGLHTLVRTENRKKCEKFGGEYVGNGKCVFTDMNEQYCETKDGVYRNDECTIDVDRLNEGDWNPFSSKNSASSVMAPVTTQVAFTAKTLARTEKRKTCEKKGGMYIGNGKCVFSNMDGYSCGKKGGVFRNDECTIDVDDL